MKEDEIINFIKENKQFFKTEKDLVRQLKNSGYHEDEIYQALANYQEPQDFEEGSDDDYEVQEDDYSAMLEETVQDEEEYELNRQRYGISKDGSNEDEIEEQENGLQITKVKLYLIIFATILVIVSPFLPQFIGNTLIYLSGDKQVEVNNNLKLTDNLEIITDESLAYSYHNTDVSSVIIIPFKYVGSNQVRVLIYGNEFITNSQTCMSNRIENVDSAIDSNKNVHDSIWRDENSVTFWSNHTGVLYFNCENKLTPNSNLEGNINIQTRDFETDSFHLESGKLKIKIY